MPCVTSRRIRPWRGGVLCLACGAVLGSSESALAGRTDYATARLSRRLPAVRAAGAIAVDGRLDEAAWQQAPVASGFIRNDSDTPSPPDDGTEVRFIYDDVTLYVGITAFDREPRRLSIPELKEDFSPAASDAVVIVLDTFHDERNGFMFSVNPAGARWDGQQFNEGREINASWDAVWNVRARVTETGWTAELAIPFRTLKFPGTSPQTWGLNIMRRVARRSEDSLWAPVPRMYSIHRVSMAGTLEGLTGLRSGRDIRVKPYVLSSVGRDATQRIAEAQAGFDVKYGLAAGLTLDLTANTDFSQVEVDEQQINLTRFSLQLAEKRDFFSENSGIFVFGPGNNGPRTLGAAGFDNPAASGVVGGRQNLREPVLFFSRRIGLIEETGEAVPILAGVRLSGRRGPFTVGALSMQQRAGTQSLPTNFTAVRVRRDVFRNSDIGLMFLNRDERGAHFNRVIGVDANVRAGDLVASALLAGSVSDRRREPAGSGLMTRVGGHWLGRTLELKGAISTIGARFDDQMGFIQRSGIRKGDVAAGVHWRPARMSRWLREWFPHWSAINVTRERGGLDSRYFDYHVQANLRSGTVVDAGLNANTEDITAPFLVNPRRRIGVAPARYDFDEYFVAVTPNTASAVAWTLRSAVGGFYDGRRSTQQVGATVRANEHLNVSATVNRNRIDLTAGAFTTYLVTSRINVGFSTRVFLNALLQYNTDARQWSSNVRFNLIHHPLSDIFVVYNERRAAHSGALIDRAFVAKVTHMLAF